MSTHKVMGEGKKAQGRGMEKATLSHIPPQERGRDPERDEGEILHSSSSLFQRDDTSPQALSLCVSRRGKRGLMRGKGITAPSEHKGGGV